jgi:sarcosine oxidase subunit gamma
MNMIKPESSLQRSPIYRELIDDKDKNSLDAPCLIDFSLVPRMGYRGTNAEQYLRSMNFPIPEKANQCLMSEQGEWVLRLSQKEFWLLSQPQENINSTLLGSTLPDRECYSLYCQNSHAWFALTGKHCPDILAKICSVDLRASHFPVGAVVQTSVARVNAIIVHHVISGEQVFSILSDSASATYLWNALLDAMAEYGGRVEKQ